MALRAFVTGGTGFLGINLLRKLCAEGWETTAIRRASSDMTFVADLPVNWEEATIEDVGKLDAVIPENLDAIFHLAGDTNMWSKMNGRQYQTNVIGTRNLIETSLKKSAKCFVYVSSISAWGAASGRITEETPQLGGESWINYEKTKYLGEQEAKKAIGSAMKVVIINPGSIVGAFDQSNWATTFFALKENKVPGVPPGTNSFVHVNDVVHCLVAAVEKGADGENYLVTGPDTSMQEFVTEAGRIMGLNKVPKKLPKWLLLLVVGLEEFKSRFTGKEPTLTRETVTFMCRKGFGFSNEKALKTFGYEMKPWQNGLRECYDWLVNNKLI